MDKSVPEVDVDSRFEVLRLQAELERRTQAWRDALRLVSEAEARCQLLEEMLLLNGPAQSRTAAAPSDPGIDWAGLQTAAIRWSQV